MTEHLVCAAIAAVAIAFAARLGYAAARSKYEPMLTALATNLARKTSARKWRQVIRAANADVRAGR